MTKNPNAVALGKKSWAKRRKNPKHKEQLSKAGKAGAAKRWKRTVDTAPDVSPSPQST